MPPDPLRPPASYQGSKRLQGPRIAQEILAGGLPPTGRVYDLCCGSGCVSLALVDAGVPASRLVMVDAGPWADVYASIGRGTFPMATLLAIVQRLPRTRGDQPEFLRHLKDLQLSAHGRLAAFVVLQAGSFAGMAVTEVDGMYRAPGFSFKMGMLSQTYDRVARLQRRLRGLTALRCPVSEVPLDDAAIVYVDPPYEGTTGYRGLTVDLPDIVRRAPCPVYISEARVVPGATRVVDIPARLARSIVECPQPAEVLSVFDWPRA